MNPSKTSLRKIALPAVLLGCVILAGASHAADTYYVDGTGGSDSNSGNSLSAAWATLGKANTVLQAGDTVFIRGGTYNGQKIDPANSGSAAAGHISYRAYNGEVPVITNPPNTTVDGKSRRTAIVLDGNSYIRIDGIKVDGQGMVTVHCCSM